MLINKDAFSNGQIDSKLWLCEQLENILDKVDNIWIYGGWYGLTAFLLKSRNNIKIGAIRSFDIDPACEVVADTINENWVFKEWQFKAETRDCNKLKPVDVDLIINTSTEHFDSLDWFYKIPKNTFVALQGNNMTHDDHVITFTDLSIFEKTFNLSKILYSGERHFVYPSWSFTRFMIIGVK